VLPAFLLYFFVTTNDNDGDDGGNDDDDDGAQVEDYDRTFDEDEEYGIHDMDVGDEEHYGHLPKEEGEGQGDNPNRALLHKRWGPDHPHEFAKGCDDDTQPTPLGSAQDAGGWATAGAGEAPCAGTAGGAEAEAPSASSWTGPMSAGREALKLREGTSSQSGPKEVVPVGSEEPTKGDEALEFVASASFSGAKQGFAFRTGSKGVGYYSDAR